MHRLQKLRVLQHVSIHASMCVVALFCSVLAQEPGQAQDYIVQIAADSTEQAAEIVSVLHEPCDPPSATPCDYTFQVVEATTSFVDSIDALGAFVLESPPMLQLKTELTWNADARTFSMQYESVASDAYKRVLYFQASDFDAQSGDAGNVCLSGDYSNDDDNVACWQELRNSGKYVLVSDNIPSDLDVTKGPTEDMIARSDTSSGLEIIVSKPDSTSAIDLITITISQDAIFGLPGNLALATHKTLSMDGNNLIYYSMGIGMLYWHSQGHNVIIFDLMHLIENNVNQWHATTINQYTLARHINFQVIQTETAQNERDVQNNLGKEKRAVMLQILLNAPFMLEQDLPGNIIPSAVKISYWKHEQEDFFEITSSHQSELQGKLSEQETHCFNPRALQFGTPNVHFIETTINDVIQEQQIVTILTAIPDDASVLYDDYNEPALKLSIALKLCRIDDSVTSVACDPSATQILSIMNLESVVAPTPVCTAALQQEFSSVDLVQMSMFIRDIQTQKLNLRAECSSEVQCSQLASLYQNEVVAESFDILSSLVFVGIHPIDTLEAKNFFAESERVAQLDDMYITHDIDQTHGLNLQTSDISNTHMLDANFRNQLQLDPRLISGNSEECYLQSNIVAWDETIHKCITTHDFDVNGPIDRPNLNGGPSSKFVHELFYIGSAIVRDTEAAATFSVAKLVTFVLYIPASHLLENIDFVDTQLTITQDIVKNVWQVAYNRFFIEFLGHESSYYLTLSGAAANGGDTVITFDHNPDLDAAVELDLTWLAQFYNSEAQTEKLAFYQDSRAQIPSHHAASFYWINPTFHWPVTLLGLMDSSLLSMAWSVSIRNPESTSGDRRRFRRLLQDDASTPALTSYSNVSTWLQQATSMNMLGKACALHTDTRNFSHLQWRDVLLRTLNCTAEIEDLQNTSEDKTCNLVRTCDYYAAKSCVIAITEAGRQLHTLVDWESPVQWNASIVRVNNESKNNSSLASLFCQQSGTACDIDGGIPPAAVIVEGNFTCQIGVAIKNSLAPPVVLAVPYDNAIPPPLELKVTLPDSDTSCSLAALATAMLPMQLLHVTTHDAIFVSPEFVSTMLSRSNIHDSMQAKYQAAHRAAWNADRLAVADSAHIRAQKSFLTLPRLTLQWLHSRPSVLQNTEQARIALTCGSKTYHEQLDFAHKRHTRRMQSKQLVRKPSLRVYRKKT